MATHEELVGVYAATRWQASDGSNYVIGLLEDGSCVKGPAEPGELVPNLPYKFYGSWRPGNGQYGPSFNFVCAVKEIPHSRNAVVEYLIRAFRGKNLGIGHAKAHALYDVWQADAVRMVRMHPTEVAEKLGHDVDKCRAASAILEVDRRFEDSKIQLTDLFAGKGFPRTSIKECIDRWGAKAPAMIRRDAFLLMTQGIKGAGFNRCDNLFLALGGNAAKLKRQTLAAWYGLNQHGSGDTWHSVERAIEAIESKVDAVNTRPAAAIKLGIRAGWLAIDRDHGVKLLADAKKANSEADVARLVRQMMDGKPAWPVVDSAALTDHQKEKLAVAMTGRIGILSGSPGTGKTYTAAALVRSAINKHGEGSILACSPTGKAAVRFTETMQKYNIPLQATTIHRMLAPNDLGYGTGNWNFGRNEASPLDCDFVLCDECFVRGTMVDTPFGQKPIETIEPNELILNANGIDQVVAIKTKKVNHVAIITAGKKTFISSTNHRFFTARGFKFAHKIRPGDSLVSTATAMRLLRNDDLPKKQRPVLQAFLQQLLLAEFSHEPDNYKGEDLGQQGSVVQVGVRRISKTTCSYSGMEPISAWRKWQRAYGATTIFTGSIRRRLDTGASNFAQTLRTRIPYQLQSRLRKPFTHGRYRSGRKESFVDLASRGGQKEGRQTSFIRVDSVEVLESANNRLDQYRDADGTLCLYDLKAAQHPTFSVNGLLVHNCSMVDTDLMAALLRAIPPSAHLLLIGDHYQLPPVGHGAPLRDLITSGIVPFGELSEIKRNDGLIVQACAAIKIGDKFTTCQQFDGEGNNLAIVPVGSAAGVQNELRKIFETIKVSGRRDPFEDVQVLTALNEKSEVARTKLNTFLQQILNRDGATAVGNKFRVADKAICLTNGKYPNESNRPVVPVFNGEMGRVINVAEDKTVFEFPDTGDGIRTLVIPLKSEWAKEFDTAYSITVHRSQGSEWPVVIVVADDAADRVASREHWYTSISRASERCIVLGRMATVARQCRRVTLRDRRTLLVEKLKESESESEAQAAQGINPHYAGAAAG